MNLDEYLHDRLDDQIAWFDRKSSSSQKRFKNLRLAEIVLAAAIPFLSGLATSLPDLQLAITITVGLFGMLIAALAGYLALQKFEENWIRYRVSCETLKREKFFFQTASGPYAHDQSFRHLVERVEAILSQESEQWSESAAPPPPEPAGP